MRDGGLYGRGTSDMKGGIAGFLFALECLAREDVRLAGDVTFCTNTDEESSGAGLALVAHGVRGDAGLCAEPSGFDAWVACRGYLIFTATIAGRAGHAEMPRAALARGRRRQRHRPSGAVLGPSDGCATTGATGRTSVIPCSRPATSSP